MGPAVLLVLAVFGASCVEMVEAFTIVLAAGVSRGWRSALEGTALAIVVLGALVAGVGLPLVRLVPLDTIRVVVGSLLLLLGLSWLRKAVLRASGHKALHDEDAIYAATVTELSGPETALLPATAARSGWRTGRRDAGAFTVAFKGVFLEGLEVVMIVLTLGSSSNRLGLAAAAALAAVVVVGGAGLVVARQLSAVPENAMKMGVGVMLTSFGLFWVGEGAGVAWPGSDLFLLAFVALFALTAALLVRGLRRLAPAPDLRPLGESST